LVGETDICSGNERGPELPLCRAHAKVAPSLILPHQGAQRYPAEAASSGLEEYKRSTRPRLPLGGRGVPKLFLLRYGTVQYSRVG